MQKKCLQRKWHNIAFFKTCKQCKQFYMCNYSQIKKL
nr:MAG TPA: hypothetical protein [Bacteriophage sp.]